MPGRGMRGTYHADVLVYSCDPLVCSGLQQPGRDDLLDRQHYAVLTPDADGGTAILDCLYRILDLEVPAVRREDGVGEIVTRSYGCLHFDGKSQLPRRAKESELREPGPTMADVCLQCGTLVF